MAWNDAKITGDELTAAEYNAMTADQILRVLKSLFDANTIIKADSDDTPVKLTIDEQRILGRITAGSITGLTAAQVRTLCDIPSTSEAVLDTLFDAYTILYADTDNTPAALTVAASRFVGRKAAGGIAAMTIAEAKTLLAIAIADLTDGGDIVKKDGSVVMTGSLEISGGYGIRGSDISPYTALNNSLISLYGNTLNDGAKSAKIHVFGYDHSVYPGQIVFWLPNAAKSASVNAGHFQGNTNTPKLQLTHGLITDSIAEKTGATGVTIDSCLVKDGLATSPISSTLTVAANDAKNKPRSDYQCNASADQTEINNAITALPT